MMKTTRIAMIVIGAALSLLGGCSQKLPQNATAQSVNEPKQPSNEPGNELTLDLGNKVMMELALIPAGKFVMGSPKDEQNRSNDEIQHEVTISKAFYLGAYEVTVDQYAAFVKVTGEKYEGPDFAQTGDHPVVNVTWDDAQAFCQWLSQKTGKTVVLPTEAQWEYACRAGSATAFCYGNDTATLSQYAWYDFNAAKTTHPVASKQPNAWGLYDMHGNVWEWCSDWYDNYAAAAKTDPTGAGSWAHRRYKAAAKTDPTGPRSGAHRVSRGGTWGHTLENCRSANRGRNQPEYGWTHGGFRVAVVEAGVD